MSRTQIPQLATFIHRSATVRQAWHLAFRVATYADFRSAQSELQSRDVSFQFQDHEISYSVYFYDPDGFLLEITTYDLTNDKNE